jgi:hypothetical protein
MRAFHLEPVVRRVIAMRRDEPKAIVLYEVNGEGESVTQCWPNKVYSIYNSNDFVALICRGTIALQGREL